MKIYKLSKRTKILVPIFTIMSILSILIIPNIYIGIFTGFMHIPYIIQVLEEEHEYNKMLNEEGE
jgi:hypothetical protein